MYLLIYDDVSDHFCSTSERVTSASMKYASGIYVKEYEKAS